LYCRDYILAEQYFSLKQEFVDKQKGELFNSLSQLFEEYKFEEADKFYQENCSKCISINEYDLQKSGFLAEWEAIRRSLFLKLDGLLINSSIKEADRFYQDECKKFITFVEYRDKKEPVLNKLKSSLIKKIEVILARYSFNEADNFYQVECKKYILNEDYQRIRQPYWDKKISLLFSELDNFFRDDFLDADEFYHLECQPYISKVEYNRIKSNFCQTWVEQNLGNKPDLEQSAAIGAVNGHVQVVARAGSGKTSTLVNRALFLQKHCGIHPSEILLLAFNRKAAAEIKERIKKHSGADIPHVITFHALAYRLVHPEEKINFDEKDGEQSLSLSLQAVISEYLDEPVYYKEIRDLMHKHFKIDSESLIAYVKYRRSLPKEGIDGRYYKSRGEKIIADFLFEHDIPYTYEKSFWWRGINYRPDFTIERPTIFSDNGLVIEYFGLQGDPEYDEMSEAKREYWQKHKRDWDFLELDPQVLTTQGRNAFENNLKYFLQDYFGIACNRLSEEQIWLKIKERAVNRFTKAVVSFVQRTRQLCLTADQLSHKIDTYPLGNSDIENIEAQFLILVQDFYKSYLDRIEEVGEEDFNGLMQRAAITVNDGMTEFKGRSSQGDLKSLKYIMIDEYQDFSLLFSNLIQAIRNQNPKALFFCVGDDWQAINGFAGSDLHYYNNFASIFNPSQKLNIATNYRSRAKIVEIGNKLMQGRGVTSVAHNRQSGIIDLIDLSKFQPLPIEQERHRSDLLTPAILRLANKFIQENKEVVLLSRKNNLSGNIITDSDGDMISSIVDFRKNIIERLGLPEHLQHLLTISTAHQYKGKEGQIVIVLDIQSYPLIHPDWIFTRIFGDSIDKIIDDDRRLLYVALTRAKEHLFIITDNLYKSEFAKELAQKFTFPTFDWDLYPFVASEVRYITVKVSNQNGVRSGGTFAIRQSLRSENYEWNGSKQYWARTYNADLFLRDQAINHEAIVEFFNNSTWASRANGVEVAFCDEHDNILMTYHVNQPKQG
jgi:DNA helicase-4